MLDSIHLHLPVIRSAALRLAQRRASDFSWTCWTLLKERCDRMSEIIERIERQVGVLRLVLLLAERLPPTDLQSLLLEVHRLRAKRRQPASLLADYETNRFVRPSSVSPKRLVEWDRIAFAELPPGFQAVSSSAVCPLGTWSVVAPISQN